MSANTTLRAATIDRKSAGSCTLQLKEQDYQLIDSVSVDVYTEPVKNAPTVFHLEIQNISK